MLCTRARYSFFAGSITRNGILCSFHNLSSSPTEKVVLPDPGVPTISMCLARSFSDSPIETSVDDDLRLPSRMSPALIRLLEYVLLFLAVSFTVSPAFTLSLPMGSRKKLAASSEVMISGKRNRAVVTAPLCHNALLRPLFASMSFATQGCE